MSSISLTQAQLQQVLAVRDANQNNPAAIWSVLSSFGDQYAAAAFTGITNPQSVFGMVIQASNAVANPIILDNQVAVAAVENRVATGYVALIARNMQDNNLYPDGTIPLPTTTQIEQNYAELSEEAEAKLEGGEHLTPNEWKSGDRIWLVELISPYATPENKLQEAMLVDLVKGPFKDVEFFLHRTDPTSGKREKITMSSHLNQRAN